MNAEKLAYWSAVAVFALVLHSSYQRGAFPAVHQAAARAGSKLCRATAKAEQSYLLAKAFVTHDAFSTNDDFVNTYLDNEELSDLMQSQSDFVRAEAQDKVGLFRDQLRAQAEVRRAELQRRRDQMQQFRDMARVQIRSGQFATRRVMIVGPGSCRHSRLQISTAPDPPALMIVSDDDSDSF